MMSAGSVEQQHQQQHVNHSGVPLTQLRQNRPSPTILLGSRTSSNATSSTVSSGLTSSSSFSSSSTSMSSSSAAATGNTCLHTHRQNHNSSKLPAFRFADLSSNSTSNSTNNGPKSTVGLALPSLLLQHLPPSPVSVSPNNPPLPSSGSGQVQGPGSGAASGPAATRSMPTSVTTTTTTTHHPPLPSNLTRVDSRPQIDSDLTSPLPPPPVSDPPPPHHQKEASSSHSYLVAIQGQSRATIRRDQPPMLKQPETTTDVVSGSKLPRSRASTFQPHLQQAQSQSQSRSRYSYSPYSTATPTITAASTSTGTSSKTQAETKSTSAARRPASFPVSPSNRHPSVTPLSPQISAPAVAPPPPTSAHTAESSTIVPPTHPTAPVSAPATHPSSIPAATATTPRSAPVLESDTKSSPASSTRPKQSRRTATSNSIGSLSSPQSAALNTQRRHTFELSTQPSASRKTGEWAQGQRELLLPKTLQSGTSDERRVSRPPPVSYRGPLSASSTPTTATSSPTVSTPVRVPPIRGFRSSGSRRSLVLDMSSRRSRHSDVSDDDPTITMDSREDTLRALEGRPDQEGSPPAAPPLNPNEHEATDHEDTTDMFLSLAREEPARPSTSAGVPNTVDDHSAVSRFIRTTNRRPLSAAVPTYQPSSPPRISRRLSDQRETSRAGDHQGNSPADPVNRTLAYRSLAREKALSVHPGEDLSRRATTSARPSPITPRNVAFQDAGEGSAYTRRRTSISDSAASRSAPYKQSNLSYQFRSPAYHSSPLASRSDNTLRAEPQHSTDYGHAVEGTESTASTTGPSTVWDELDDLKSRINRLELTGKLPSTSGAAMSRVSDERPYTANTTVTNVSVSPKRVTPSVIGIHTDGTSNSSAPREAHPVLHASLAKAKTLLSTEVYRALETTTTDALALLSMMGTAGQPGPISSGASTIAGPNVTDRQLRRKADSICRSLTELCLALNEENARPKSSYGKTPTQNDTPATPTVAKTFEGLAAQRRASTVVDQNQSRITTSPRAMTKLEERRNNLLNGSALPSPRIIPSSLAAPTETGPGRRSSLLLSRRRAGTEEPEDGRRSSLLLRTRRGATEEPEDAREARKPSLLRPRRGTLGEEEDESRFRAPSRATTEVTPAPAPSRAISRDYSTQGAEPAPPTSSALPRRRFGLSSLTSRLAIPSSPASATARRYVDGSASASTVAQERGPGPRPFALGQTAMVNRTTSISRRNRDGSTVNGPGAGTGPESAQYR